MLLEEIITEINKSLKFKPKRKILLWPTVGLHYDNYQKIKSVNVELCDPYNKVNTLESQHTRNNSPHMFVSRVLVS